MRFGMSSKGEPSCTLQKDLELQHPNKRKRDETPSEALQTEQREVIQADKPPSRPKRQKRNSRNSRPPSDGAHGNHLECTLYTKASIEGRKTHQCRDLQPPLMTNNQQIDHGLLFHQEFSCPYCLHKLRALRPVVTQKEIRDAFYGTRADVRQHILAIHWIPFECCAKTFGSTAKYNKHLTKDHGVQKAHRRGLRNMGSNRGPKLAKLIKEMGRCRTYSQLERCMYRDGVKVFDAEDGSNRLGDIYPDLDPTEKFRRQQELCEQLTRQVSNSSHGPGSSALSSGRMDLPKPYHIPADTIPPESSPSGPPAIKSVLTATLHGPQHGADGEQAAPTSPAVSVPLGPRKGRSSSTVQTETPHGPFSKKSFKQTYEAKTHFETVDRLEPHSQLQTHSACTQFPLPLQQIDGSIDAMYPLTAPEIPLHPVPQLPRLQSSGPIKKSLAPNTTASQVEPGLPLEDFSWSTMSLASDLESPEFLSREFPDSSPSPTGVATGLQHPEQLEQPEPPFFGLLQPQRLPINSKPEIESDEPPALEPDEDYEMDDDDVFDRYDDFKIYEGRQVPDSW